MKLRMAKRTADRNSMSLSPVANPVIGCFQASNAAVMTAVATGVKVWPLPQRTPQNPTMISAADVVNSKL